MREADRIKLLKMESLEQGKQQSRQEKSVKHLSQKVARGSYAELLLRAGISCSPRWWLIAVIGVSVFSAVVITKGLGALSGLTLGVVFGYYLFMPFLRARAEKRRQAAVPHLPALIDALEASLRAGYNLELALEHATTAIPDGILHAECRRVVMLINNKVSLEDSLDYLTRRISGQEIISLVIAIKLFADMGGRMLAPLQRLGQKMRQQRAVLERASRDLVGTKQAFYVILALYVIAPVFLIMTEPNYFKTAFEHPTISYIMELAVVLQVLCIFVFKRIATLRV
jgi:Flp pilus assembly protein TadB